jgi:NAD(P)H-hydrate epimerase
VWLHGAAGDKAARKSGQQALIAGDIIRNIGKAFQELKKDHIDAFLETQANENI